MRYLYFFLFTFFFSYNFYSQDAYLMAAVDTAPVIKECGDSKDTKDCFNDRLNHHIQTNLDIRKTYHTAGKAYVQFKVTAAGEVKDVKVRAEDDSHREEAKRVIELLEIREPATLNGERVAVLHSMPISFRTKNFNSYQDYQKSDIFKEAVARKIAAEENAAKEIVVFEDLATPPLFSECESISEEKDCFTRTTKIKLKLHLQQTRHDLQKGTRIKYYFQIDPEGKVINVAVNGPGKLTNRKATELLESLSFLQPALDANGNPVKTEILGELVF